MSDIPARLRRLVLRRADGRCEYCRLAQAGQEATFHIDHITPVAVGGATAGANLALACVSCSLRKGARQTALDPQTGDETALYHPRRDLWPQHFQWEEVTVIGLTPHDSFLFLLARANGTTGECCSGGECPRNSSVSKNRIGKRGKKKFVKHLLIIWSALLMLAAGRGAFAKDTGVRGAAGRVDITPEKPAYIAGYEMNRLSVGAHDRLMARCLVLESNGVKIAFVSCDVIGLPRYQIEKIRANIKTVKPSQVYIAATHTHSGPDTLGQWGRDLTTSGVDAGWMTSLRAKVAALVDETAAKLQPVALKFANTTDVPRISKNSRVPQILDTELGVMQVISNANHTPVATFVNYACHPEVLDTRQISADFPHWLYETVEPNGGVCLYLNGAQGGMITADFDETTAPRGQNWKAAETIGISLGKRVLEILATAPITLDVPIQTEQRVFAVPLENPKFQALIALKIFPQDVLKNGSLETEVNRITIGPAEFLTLPGEVLPNIGFYLKHFMQGKPKFLLGLCCDELGYILTPEDYALQLYKYESSVSVGPQIEPLMVQNLRALMKSK